MRFGLGFCALLPALLLGQETRSMIFGRVLDPQSSAVAGASVLVTNAGTNVAVKLTTNDTGYYEANLLLPGDYRVVVEASGFKKAIRSGIVLPVSTRTQVDVTLELGAVTESVSVVAEASLLETNAVSSGRVLDNRNMMELPALGNNPMLLVMLTPGIQAGGENKYNTLHTLSGASDYSTAGKVGGNEWSIDGAPNTRGRETSYMPAADTLQEFKVETSNFDASVGHNTGVAISMMTKTGTNSPHGTLMEQYWNQRWNGTEFFTKQKYWRDIATAEAAGNTALAQKLRSQDMTAAGHSNNYAATLGGPVYIPKVIDGRDKLFFFFSWSAFETKRPNPGPYLNHTVPTAANRAGDFSNLLQVDASRYQIYDPLTVRPDPARPTHYIRDPIPGNILPSTRIVNPVYNSYLKFIPLPNNDPASTLEPTNNYLAIKMPLTESYAQQSNRVDYQPSGKHRFFGSWRHYTFLENRQDWAYEVAPGLHNIGNNWEVVGGTANWVYATPRTIVDLTAAINQYRATTSNTEAFNYKPSDVGFPAYMDTQSGPRSVLPRVVLGGYDTVGVLAPQLSRNRVLSQKADVTHIRGAHTLRAGADSRQYFRTAIATGDTAPSGQFTFSNVYTRRNDDSFTPAGSLGHSWAAFMMGLPESSVLQISDSQATHSPMYAIYAQDSWRAGRKLTLNFGLRLEYEGGPTERYNRAIGWFDSTAKLPISDAAAAAYARNPVAERAASTFSAVGGSVYAGGAGGRSVFQGEWMWLPKLSAAYQLDKSTVIRAGYGLFFDTLNAFNVALRQTGYTLNTSTTMTTDFGVNWLAGDPKNGISPLRDPFPVRADGTRFDQPLGNALGLMASSGRGFTHEPYDAKRARQQRWRAAIQRQLSGSMVVEAAYAGSYSDRVYVSRNLNALPEQYWADGLTRNAALASNLDANVTNPFALANFASLRTSDPVVYRDMSTNSFFTSSTIRKSQLLRPYPQVNGLTANSYPAGFVRTHSIELSLERRFAKGFNLNAGYTWMRGREANFYANEFDASPTWRESNGTRPHRFVVSGIYQFPFGKGKALVRSGPASWIVGGWQLALTYEWQPGPLLDWGNIFYYGDPNDVATGTSTLDRWFNTDNFERTASKGPASYHKRVFPTRIDNVRRDMTNQWNGNVSREFRFKERVAFQLRLDAINLTNRSQFAAPDINPYSSTFGKVLSQTEATHRIIQVVGRLRF
jgi:hypothetical protein